MENNLANSGSIFCSKCGTLLLPTQRFCPNCGQKYVDPNVCGRCGAALQAGSSFCSSCGKRISLATSGFLRWYQNNSFFVAVIQLVLQLAAFLMMFLKNGIVQRNSLVQRYYYGDVAVSDEEFLDERSTLFLKAGKYDSVFGLFAYGLLFLTIAALIVRVIISIRQYAFSKKPHSALKAESSNYKGMLTFGIIALLQFTVAVIFPFYLTYGGTHYDFGTKLNSSHSYGVAAMIMLVILFVLCVVSVVFTFYQRKLYKHLQNCQQ